MDLCGSVNEEDGEGVYYDRIKKEEDQDINLKCHDETMMHSEVNVA